jgi:hypothetical protein
MLNNGQVKYFYNVDTPFFLQFVDSFLKENSYPPQSKVSNISTFNYHYGVMAMAAMISEITNIDSRFIFLFFLPVLLLLANAIVSFEIIKNELKSYEESIIFIGFLLFYICGQFYFFSFTTINDFFYKLFKEENFWAYYPQLPGLFGYFLLLFSIFLCNNIFLKSFKTTAIFILAITPLFKIPYMPIIGLGIGLNVLYTIYIKKNSSLISVPIFGGLFMIFNYLFFSFNFSQSTSFDINLFSYYNKKLILLYIVFILLFIIVIYKIPKYFVKNYKFPLYIFFFFVPLFIISLFIEIKQLNAYQIFLHIPKIAWLHLVLFSLYIYIKNKSKLKKHLFIFIAIILIFLPVFASVKYIYNLYIDPSSGHEFVDNTELNKLLISIPLNNTIIAVSDNRYPANNFARPNSQFQISALYGHKCFNCDLTYSKPFLNNNDFQNRLLFTQLLSSKYWNSNLFDIIRKEKITHVILSKNIPMPQSVPFKLLSETENYLLYKVNISKD